MAMNFHDGINKNSYSGRKADKSWLELIADKVRWAGIKAADIGCGGGIYTRALVELGAAEAVGIDFSQAMLEGAAANCAGAANIHFQLGNALQTGLPGGSMDVVLERALIHHLSGSELVDCFKEAFQALRPGGTLIVQDRTPADCLLEGSKQHLRGYFFEKFPSLKEKEIKRRHSSEAVVAAITDAGFKETEMFVLWETRKRYAAFSEFLDDLLKRTGRSVLHELNDLELAELAQYIQKQTGYSVSEPLEEKDRWTVWIARKKD